MSDDAFLTKKEQAYKSQITMLSDRIKNDSNELRKLMRQCKHVFHPLTEKDKDILRERPWDASYKTSSACCYICGEDLGWRCSESPDTLCHYFSYSDDEQEFYVYLTDKSKHVLPNYTSEDANYETDDCCLFCGHPEERK